VALFNAFAVNATYGENETALLVNIGSENMDIAIQQGGELLFARNTTPGGAAFTSAIQQAFATSTGKAEQMKVAKADVTPRGQAKYADSTSEKVANAIMGVAGQLAGLIQSTLMIARAQAKLPDLKIDRVLLAGGGASLKGLDLYLKQAMGVPVERMDPFAISDLSALRKFEVVGPDAEALMQYTLTRNVRKLSVGQVVYSAMCYETGGMLDDGTAFRLGPDNFRWICGDDYCGVWLREQAEKLGLKVWVKSSTDQMHNISVQGPKSREILKQVVWTKPDQPTVEELGWFRFTIGRLGDPNGPSIIVSRTGYTGELGFEVWCHPKDAPALWDAVWDAGRAYQVAPLGLDALDMLRIEAGLIFYGYEFADQTDPFGQLKRGTHIRLTLRLEDPDHFHRRKATFSGRTDRWWIQQLGLSTRREEECREK